MLYLYCPDTQTVRLTQHILTALFVDIGCDRQQHYSYACDSVRIGHLLDNRCVEALLDAMINGDEEMLLDCVISRVHPSSKIQEAVEMFKKTYRCRDVADGGGGGDWGLGGLER
ncbi:hypothetical protein Tco_1322996 [Tanacetum coccineum]